MQISQSGLKKGSDRPECPVDAGHRVHRHGRYERCAKCDGEERESIFRYLCVFCRLTISVLPDDRLPYRSLGLDLLKRWLNWQFCDAPGPPPMTEKERGCAKRTLRVFESHSPTLKTALGQIVQDVGADAASLWRTLVRLSKTEPILHFLQAKLKPLNRADAWRGFSLLGTYRCRFVPPMYSG
ncbi:MAG: hypothetical protein WCK89_20770 [bacterium]